MADTALSQRTRRAGRSKAPAARMHTPAMAAEANTRFRWLILAGLIMAAVMEVLDTTIINVALPQMAGNLGATTQEIAWVSTGYILSNVVVLPMTAFLTARFGRKHYLDRLHHSLHRRVVLLRHVAQPGRARRSGASCRARAARRCSRRRRRRWCRSSRAKQQGAGAGALPDGIIVAPTARPDAGRLDHG